MALEYLVSQQCENLNLMEVDDYQEVCFSHQLFQMSICFENLIFSTSKIVMSTEWP